MMIKFVLLTILLVFAIVSDTREFKIKNKLNLIFIVIGIVTNYILHGEKGLSNAVLGLIAPFCILLILYILRMLGAGDIKLFCAIGAIVGLFDVLRIMAYSFLLGGIIALFIILTRKNGINRFKYLFGYIKNTFLLGSIQPYMDFKENSCGRFPFAYAIFTGLLVYGVGYFVK